MESITTGTRAGSIRTSRRAQNYRRTAIKLLSETVFGALFPKRMAENRRKQSTLKTFLLRTVIKTLALCVKPLSPDDMPSEFDAEHPEASPGPGATMHTGFTFDLGLRPKQ